MPPYCAANCGSCPPVRRDPLAQRCEEVGRDPATQKTSFLATAIPVDSPGEANAVRRAVSPFL